MAIVFGNQRRNSSGGGIQNLLQRAASANNGAQQLARSFAIQNNNVRNSRNLMTERLKNAKELVDYRNTATADLDSKRTADTLSFAQTMFPGKIGTIDPADFKYLTPATAKTFINAAMTTVPSEDRKRIDFKVGQSENVSPGLRPKIQEDVNTYISGTDTNVNQGTPVVPFKPATETTTSSPVPGAFPKSYIDNGSDVATDEESLANANFYKRETLKDQGKENEAFAYSDSFSTEGKVDTKNSPIVRRAAIKDMEENTRLGRLEDVEAYKAIDSDEQILGLDGQPIQYSDGTVPSNSMQTYFATKNYELLKESGDQQKLADWNKANQTAINTFVQTADAFRKLQDYTLDNPQLEEQAQTALFQVRKQYNRDLEQYADLAEADPDQAASYGTTLAENLRKGLTQYAQFLPTNQNGANLRQAFTNLTGVLALQLAKDLNGGRPSDADKQGIVDSLGSAMNDPITLFSKQSGMLSFLADKVGHDVLATREPFVIKQFNDVYKALQGTNFDPKGALYEGQDSIRTNQVDVNTLDSQGGGDSFGGLTPEELAELEELERLESEGLL